MKFSRQRELILQTLHDNPVHPTADYIYAKVREQMPNISLGTVYRNLKQLADNGMIKSIDGLDGTTHFDHYTETHYHFICNKCKKIYDIDSSLLPDMTQKISEETGFLIESHDITLRGICSNCLHHK